MKQKWQQRKTKSDFTSKETKTVKYDTRTTSDKIRDMIQSEAQKIEDAFKQSQQNDESDDKLSKIRLKYMYGGNLSPDELDYIRQKDTKLYNEIQAEKEELKSFEKKLRAARTKDETQRVIADECNAALSKVNSVSNNPNVSEADKMAVCAAEYRKLMKKQTIFKTYVEKGEYAKLPTDAEKRKAEKEIREAREEELRNAGRKEETEYHEDSDGRLPEETGLSHSENDVNASTDDTKDSFRHAYDDDEAKTLSHNKDYREQVIKGSSHKSKDAGVTGEKTVTEEGEKVYKSTVRAESTPEALKVKRAKHNTGQKKLYEQDDDDVISTHTWDA
ncbi:hypothetical protein [Oribacterium sp. WCC10]|uniref:hypothetical protein n=1 Tax=Oribacterium sp. WCC10 TaxID=1855343 RepID=UPI000B893657|nr:hypothetical protein [Oribacterium sp. WCC10]